ncbi:MAG: hypothetical protein KA275_05415 [Chitinophagaceae bacterium]|nr:hypothetical protein [Chitinophagaceae bacterium]
MTFLYLDPGSSSYFLQIIAAGALGAIIFIKNFWYSIKAFFTGKKRKENDEEIEHNASSTDENQ